MNPDSASSRTSRRRLPTLLGAAVLLGWAAFVFLLVPQLIRQAYRGESLAFFNDLITGQAQHPVDHYLASWYSLAIRMSVAALFLAAALGVSVRKREVLTSIWTRFARHLPQLRDREVFVLAAAIGLVAGLAEAARAAIWYWVRHRAAGEAVSGEVFWMAPLAAVCFLLAAATAAVVLRRGTRWGGFVALAPFVFAAAATYSFARSMVLGIYPLALLILSLGIAWQVNRSIARRPDDWLKWGRRLVAAGAIALTMWAIWLPQSRRIAETRAKSALPTVDGERPNILLIVWDTVRAMSLSVYGHERPTTPTLERLAETGAVFDGVVSTSSWTLPAHASLFTGRYHHEHSATRETPLDDTFPTIAEALDSRGYQTGGFVANTYWVGSGFGLDRGFQWYQDSWFPTLHAIIGAWWLTRDMRTRVNRRRGLYPDYEQPSAKTVNEAFLTWIDRRERDRPFFAFLNLFDAHEPYLPPDGRFEFSDTEPRYWWNWARPQRYSPDDLRQLREAYDACILYLDRQLDWLLRELDARDLLANTLVVVTSDHGETLGEHADNLLGHDNNVYYDALNVPLLFYFPDRFPQRARHRLPVSLVDVPATILEIADGRPSGHPFPGNSLAAYLHDPANAAATEFSPLLSQANPAKWHRDATAWPISQGPLHSLIVGTEHYIVNSVEEETLFDLSEDPWERNDISRTPDRRRAVELYRAQLQALLGAVDPAAADPGPLRR